MSRLTAILSSPASRARVRPHGGGLGRRLGWAAMACVAALTLSACGGGTQSKKFVPTKVVSFGDENSYLGSTGLKYTVNDVALDTTTGASTTTTPTYVCGNNPIWVQTVAAYYGFDSVQCPVTGAARNAVFLANDPTTTSTDATGAISATNAGVAVTNAGVAKVITKINSNLSQMDSGTLVLVMAGQPDVLKAYSDYLAGGNVTTLTNDLKAKGTLLAQALIPVVNTGARVMLVRTPRVSLAPLGVAGGSVFTNGSPDSNQTVLYNLTIAFNDGLTNEAQRNFDGRQLGLARADDLVNTIVVASLANTATYGFTNWTTNACSAASTTVPLCATNYEPGNTTGVVAAGASTTYLWADATHLSPAGHSRLASLVLSAIARNPF